nr:short-chain dehydrogenase TIC 32 B, chloroplastic-like [Lolium perenne]
MTTTMLSSLRYLAGTAGPSGFGSRTTAEEVTDGAGDLSHITAIVTGATSGIGAETARVLAKRGARLVLPARNLKAAEDARARLLAELGPATNAGRVVVLPLELSSLGSARGVPPPVPARGRARLRPWRAPACASSAGASASRTRCTTTGAAASRRAAWWPTCATRRVLARARA